MTSIDDVLAWDLSGLPTAAAQLATLTDRLWDASREAVVAAGSDEAWHGATHDAATQRVGVVAVSMRRSAQATSTATDYVRGSTAILENAQSTLRARVLSARNAGFTVAPDGSVTHADPERRADSLYLTEAVQQLLATAGEFDRVFASEIYRTALQIDGSGDAVGLPDGSSGNPDKAAQALHALSPERRRTYWESLSRAEKDKLLRSAPEVVGNLDGLPFDDRITANRVTMLDRLDDARESGADDDAARLRSMLTDGRTFLAYNPDTGEFIELVGEIAPDARGTAVFVPGTGTAGDDVDDLRRRALALNEQTGAPIIVWANGTFPQTIVSDPRHAPLKSMAVDPRLAAENAPRLKSFTEALDAELATAAPGVETTVIGHSYGGTVVGTAEQLGMRADRVVYASAAGTGALPGVGWHNPDSDVARYSITPPGDLIHYAQDGGGLLHGGDPDDADGVVRLDSGYLSPDDHGHRALLEGPSSHSAYLDDPGSDAFGAIADVIVGDEPARYVDRRPDMHQVDDLTEDVVNSASAIGRLSGHLLLDTVAGPARGLLGLFD
ncbi:alpha/beta hydrolase [Gordonia liuliyuniae]|uniref:Alpha/beta hydrolase family protein n=1 Tax=Gordonia liuliyuniae TaxID=2911517 RepID=A0ABS9IWG2_9ACTN|nr:alpha/beta hydrolase [Gordonia liuliyuniae]MCF8589871.1 alpha/beta hydrolase family protein [Gordonia liuliyuniae]